MEKVKLLFAASALATISLFAINANESLAAKDICKGKSQCNSDGSLDCTRFGSNCNRNCGFLEIK